MAFQFCCPQGHVLQGDPSQVGQVFQCPTCGASFLVPPEVGGVAAGGFFQGPATWPAAGGPMASFPAGAPGMMPSPVMPMMPSATMPIMPGGQMPAGAFPMSAAQPYYAPAAVAPPTAPAEPSQPASPAESDKPQFDLGFDPKEKAELPFALGGQSEAEVAQAAPAAEVPLPQPSFAAPAFPAPAFPAPSMPGTFPAPGEGTPSAMSPLPSMPLPPMPAPRVEISSGGEDLPFAVAAPDAELAPEIPEATDIPHDAPKVLHIRCPAGHLVKAKRELLGKTGRCPACKKTFELRYEDSVEFKRSVQKKLNPKEAKASPPWVAWACLGVFVAFAAMVAIMLALSK